MRKLESKVKEIFLNEKIEYFAALSYSDCIETAPRILMRCGFEPRSVIVFLLPYYGGETVNLSRYAASVDYHIALREITASVIEGLKAILPSSNFYGYGDHSPIDERSAALSAGLGILGDNGLIINEKYGSYVFIGDIVSDVPPELLSAKSPSPIVRCEGCGACKNNCPGGILADPSGVCLSFVTQKKGELTDSETELIKRTGSVWGCDLCQSCCPHNRQPVLTPLSFFLENRVSRLTSEDLDEMSDEEFERRAFSWRGRKTVKRNLDILGI